MKKQAIEMRWLRDALLCAAIMLSMDVSVAQDPLVMQGIEKIDQNERISGDAVVGVNFINKCKIDESDPKRICENDEVDPKRIDEFDPESIYVYFGVKPKNPITTKLTTVDGRYFFSAETNETPPIPEKGWRQLTLKKVVLKNKVDDEPIPINAPFLEKNYNKDGEDRDKEIALLVSEKRDDAEGEIRLFPARWGGKQEETGYLRIRVNAEGADAYYIRLEDGNKDKGKLLPCDKASEKSQFKYDHICDMYWRDVQTLAENGLIQIIRKRGATFETPITFSIAAPR
jgi:hypothetical protein